MNSGCVNYMSHWATRPGWLPCSQPHPLSKCDRICKIPHLLKKSYAGHLSILSGWRCQSWASLGLGLGSGLAFQPLNSLSCYLVVSNRFGETLCTAHQILIASTTGNACLANGNLDFHVLCKIYWVIYGVNGGSCMPWNKWEMLR